MQLATHLEIDIYLRYSKIYTLLSYGYLGTDQSTVGTPAPYLQKIPSKTPSGRLKPWILLMPAGWGTSGSPTGPSKKVLDFVQDENQK